MSDKGSQSDVTEKVQEATAVLQGQIRNARIIGRLNNGKLEIDQDQLDELAKAQPNAVFLALNSPFDPVSQPD